MYIDGVGIAAFISPQLNKGLYPLQLTESKSTFLTVAKIYIFDSPNQKQNWRSASVFFMNC